MGLGEVEQASEGRVLDVHSLPPPTLMDYQVLQRFPPREDADGGSGAISHGELLVWNLHASSPLVPSLTPSLPPSPPLPLPVASAQPQGEMVTVDLATVTAEILLLLAKGSQGGGYPKWRSKSKYHSL